MKNYYSKKNIITNVWQFTLIIGLLLGSLCVSAQAPDFAWAKQAGNYPITDEFGYGIAHDVQGNSYVTGKFSGNATFGSITLTSSGSADVFVAKYDASGNVLWAKKAGGTGEDLAYSIAIDGSGTSYVTGKFSGSATFGSTTLTSSGNEDVFVAKYDAAGNLLWAKKAGGTKTDIAYSIAVDGSGNSYVTGKFSGSATFGSTKLTSSGSSDVFVAKYNASGNVLWAKKAGGTGEDLAYSIATDGSGTSYVTGKFAGSATFGSSKLTSSGNEDVFVAKYDATGNVLWAKKAGGTGEDIANSIAIDGSGTSYVTGKFSGSASFGSTKLTSSGSADVFVAKYDASGNVQWAKKAGGTGQDVALSIAVDGSGNNYIAGYFQGTATFGSTTLTSSGSNDVFVAKYDAAGNVPWAMQAGGTDYNDEAKSIAVDGNGNSYVTGSFRGTATFGYTTFNLINNSGNNYDVFVAKYDATGDMLWVQNADDAITAEASSIAVDGSGNSYVTGYFEGRATFGTTTLTSSGSTDVFVAKYNASGNVLWAKKAGGFDRDVTNGIAIDGSGNSYVTGYFSGSATFGSTTLTSSGDWDVFVAKYDASGNVVWAKKAGGISFDQAYSIAVDGSGNSYIAGRFYDSATFGSITLTSSGGTDVFVAKYDASGNVVWAKNAGSTNWDEAKGVAVDGSGNSYVTGSFWGSATFGSTTLTSSGDEDVFVAKYDASGNVVWAKKAGGTSEDGANSIAVDGSGNSYVTGDFSGSATFGSFTITSGDLFVVKYDASGNVLWAINDGGGRSEVIAQGIAVDGSGNSYVTGSFWGSATFGSTTLTNPSQSIDDFTFYDVFVAKYDAAGNVLWAKKAGGADNDQAYSIAVDGSGNSYVAGRFAGSATFGSTTLFTVGREAFIAKIKAAINPAKYALTTAETGSDGNALNVQDVNAYPNPFIDKLMMELTSNTAIETAKVTLNTIDGKMVFQKEVKLNKGRVSEELNGLSRLPAGMYFLMLHLDEKPIMLKVMKQ